MRSLDWRQLDGKIIHGNFCLWLVKNELSIFSAQRSTSFQILYCVWVRYTRTPNRTMHGNKDWDGSNHLRKKRNFDRIDGEPMEFEWNIFQGFNTLQLNDEVRCLLLRLGETPEKFTGRIFFMTMFNDISCESRDNEKECFSNANLVALCAKIFGKGQWTFIGPGSEKKWYSIGEDSPQGEWDHVAERMLVELAESGCPIFRATSPLSRGRLKTKGHVKLSIHSAADLETIETFSHNCSANQLSLYGTVA